MRNFEEYLAGRGRSTDPESIAELVGEDFRQFYSTNDLFLHVGDNINRTSDQIYTRLKDVYHLKRRDRIPASDDSMILESAKSLRDGGVHKRFRVMGDEMGRHNRQVNGRFVYLTRTRTGDGSSDDFDSMKF